MYMDTAHHLDLLWRFDRGLPLKEIISSKVKPGDLVIDAGCGTGLLSLWAAKAGARKVIAIDMGDLAVCARLAEENGFGDVIMPVNQNLNDFKLRENERCDVLMAMIYFNDPRRDYAQSQLSSAFRSRVLKPDGIQIPDRIEYTVHPLDWPSQDIQTRFSTMQKKIDMIESRYDLSLDGLLGRSKEIPDRTWFPKRLPSGLLDRPDAKVLTQDPFIFCRVDYADPVPAYPQELRCQFSFGGTCNTLLFTQSLYFGDHLIFSNESLSWVLNPHPVKPGDITAFQFEESWLVTSYATMTSPKS